METLSLQTECVDIKLNKRTYKKLKKLSEEEDGLKADFQNMEVIEENKIVKQRSVFFFWLAEEIRKLREEDDRIHLRLKYTPRCVKKL